jgi:hypothetical protein
MTGACRVRPRSIRFAKSLDMEYGTAIITGPSSTAAQG